MEVKSIILEMLKKMLLQQLVKKIKIEFVKK